MKASGTINKKLTTALVLANAPTAITLKTWLTGKPKRYTRFAVFMEKNLLLGLAPLSQHIGKKTAPAYCINCKESTNALALYLGLLASPDHPQPYNFNPDLKSPPN